MTLQLSKRELTAIRSDIDAEGKEGPSIKEELDESKRSESAMKDCAEAEEIIAVLERFIVEASDRLMHLSEVSLGVKNAATEMAAFLGDKTQEVGHIFGCLKQFAELTRAAQAKYDKRVEDNARKARIAARQQQQQQARANASNDFVGDLSRKVGRRASTGCIGSSGVNYTSSRNIDPKAGLMEEIRKQFICKHQATRVAKLEKLAKEEAEEDEEFESFSSSIEVKTETSMVDKNKRVVFPDSNTSIATFLLPQRDDKDEKTKFSLTSIAETHPSTPEVGCCSTKRTPVSSSCFVIGTPSPEASP